MPIDHRVPLAPRWKNTAPMRCSSSSAWHRRPACASSALAATWTACCAPPCSAVPAAWCPPRCCACGTRVRVRWATRTGRPRRAIGWPSIASGRTCCESDGEIEKHWNVLCRCLDVISLVIFCMLIFTFKFVLRQHFYLYLISNLIFIRYQLLLVCIYK